MWLLLISYSAQLIRKGKGIRADKILLKKESNFGGVCQGGEIDT